jgi:organic radical activating enzyme
LFNHNHQLATSTTTSGNELAVMEAFYTIQGEGVNAGKAAYFIRLAGCDVGCVWCDVKESWTASTEQVKSVQAIVEEAASFPSRFVVITGGEPAMQDLSLLTQSLKQKGFEIAIETSGAYPINGTIDWICVSPKKFKAPLKEVLAQAHELKVIVFNDSDFKFAESHVQYVNEKCVLLLQPEYSKFETIVPTIIDYCKLNPKWRISLQTHKALNIP